MKILLTILIFGMAPRLFAQEECYQIPVMSHDLSISNVFWTDDSTQLREKFTKVGYKLSSDSMYAVKAERDSGVLRPGAFDIALEDNRIKEITMKVQPIEGNFDGPYQAAIRYFELFTTISEEKGIGEDGITSKKYKLECEDKSIFITIWFKGQHPTEFFVTHSR